jgi:hypothetical protein
MPDEPPEPQRIPTYALKPASSRLRLALILVSNLLFWGSLLAHPRLRIVVPSQYTDLLLGGTLLVLYWFPPS